MAGPTLGLQVGHWIETFLCHGPGDLIGARPLELESEFLAFLAAAYEVQPGSGRRQVDEALLSRPKGWAKSEKAGATACAELLGPVRFDHWAKRGETSWWGYEYERDEPVGRPVVDPFVRCLATEEGQSNNTYGNVYVMLRHLVERHGDLFPRLDIGVTKTTVAGGGEVRISTAGSASKDGGKETFAVADEPHLYVLPELRDMYLTVSQNLTKRPLSEPWFLLTSTMHQPGQRSISEQVMEVVLEQGQVPDRVLRRIGRTLVDHRQGPMPESWDDDAELLDCLREAFGDAAEWALQDGGVRVLAKVRDPKVGRARACRYYLNRPMVEKGVAVDAAVWRQLAARPGLPEPGTPIAVGFDGSESGDATALVGVEMESGRVFLVGLWERPETELGAWRVPRREVLDQVSWLFDIYPVARMLCDPRGWKDEIDEWAASYGEKVVLHYPTNQYRRFEKACDRFLTAVGEGTLSHDGDPDLARHVANARIVPVNPRKPDAGVVLVKESPNSPLRIDACVAAVLAGEARGQAVAHGWSDDLEPFFAAT
jgi:hypothetical protein